MPIALFSDLHGNDRAFTAVLADMERLGITRGVCMGDVAEGGPKPVAVLDRLAALGWPVVLGNADHFLLDIDTDSLDPLYQRLMSRRAWTRSQLAEAHYEQIRAFPMVVEVELDDGRVLRAFHGSPSSFEDMLFPATPDAAPWSEPGADILAGGHTHLQWARTIGDALYVNPGAVGVPEGGLTPGIPGISVSGLARYAIAIGGSILFRQVRWE